MFTNIRGFHKAIYFKLFGFLINFIQVFGVWLEMKTENRNECCPEIPQSSEAFSVDGHMCFLRQ